AKANLRRTGSELRPDWSRVSLHSKRRRPWFENVGGLRFCRSCKCLPCTRLHSITVELWTSEIPSLNTLGGATNTIYLDDDNMCYWKLKQVTTGFVEYKIVEEIWNISDDEGVVGIYDRAPIYDHACGHKHLQFVFGMKFKSLAYSSTPS
ncbi:hypothetical protein LINPERHAP1_LOCUS26762, partial [Linum perenne]